MASPSPYRGFRFLAEVIGHAVWLYHYFSLSLRDIELILAACGIVVSYVRAIASTLESRGDSLPVWPRCSAHGMCIRFTPKNPLTSLLQQIIRSGC